MKTNNKMLLFIIFFAFILDTILVVNIPIIPIQIFFGIIDLLLIAMFGRVLYDI